MKHIMMTSGGVGSAYHLEMLVDKFGGGGIVSLFADTLIEDEDLYRFLDDVHCKLDVPLVKISDGRTPWELFLDQGFIANTRVDLCSRVLKRELMDNYLKDNFKPDECICYVGIDATEKERLERLVPRKLPYIFKSLMVEQQVELTAQRKKEWCDRLNIKIPRLYEFGFPHNNCGGFCVKSGLGQFKKLYEKLPERYLWHESEEQRVIKANPRLRPFLRKTIQGRLRYLTLKEYREEFLDPGIDVISAVTNSKERMQLLLEDMQDGGCGCALE